MIIFHRKIQSVHQRNLVAAFQHSVMCSANAVLHHLKSFFLFNWFLSPLYHVYERENILEIEMIMFSPSERCLGTTQTWLISMGVCQAVETWYIQHSYNLTWSHDIYRSSIIYNAIVLVGVCARIILPNYAKHCQTCHTGREKHGRKYRKIPYLSIRDL